ncbi:hypothetical protein, partial [Neisseria meningitidis]|uniref:hypothetical protein n=1 Tax=Neisseria meningitidis TaxID=487 RepID=UPI001C9A1788
GYQERRSWFAGGYKRGEGRCGIWGAVPGEGVVKILCRHRFCKGYCLSGFSFGWFGCFIVFPGGTTVSYTHLTLPANRKGLNLAAVASVKKKEVDV